jgi:hypothetical protein
MAEYPIPLDDHGGSFYRFLIYKEPDGTESDIWLATTFYSAPVSDTFDADLVQAIRDFVQAHAGDGWTLRVDKTTVDTTTLP